MALDVVAACEKGAEQEGSQWLSVALAGLFAVYILVDSLLAGWVIVRTAREAEQTSLGKVVPGTVVSAGIGAF